MSLIFVFHLIFRNTEDCTWVAEDLCGLETEAWFDFEFCNRMCSLKLFSGVFALFLPFCTLFRTSLSEQLAPAGLRHHFHQSKHINAFWSKRNDSLCTKANFVFVPNCTEMIKQALGEPRDNDWLLAFALFKKPLQPPSLPPHPLQLAPSQADLHFRASGPRTDQVAPFTAAKTLRAPFSPWELTTRSVSFFLSPWFLLWARLPRNFLSAESGAMETFRHKKPFLIMLCTTADQREHWGGICLIISSSQIQFGSYLWSVLRQWPWLRFWPSDRSGQHRTCRLSTSSGCFLRLRGRNALQKPGSGLTLWSLASGNVRVSLKLDPVGGNRRDS